MRCKYPLIGTLLMLAALPAMAFDYLQRLPEQPPIPADNPQTPAKIALGKRLFFDTQLLGKQSRLSCNSCHNLAEGGEDGQPNSLGQNGQRTQRSAPSLWNIGFQTVLYWDGRAISLESQTLDHLRDPVINQWPNLGVLVDALNASADYRQAFRAAFPEEQKNFNAINGANIARALSSFQRTLLTRDSAFDRYLAGDKNALSASAKRGIAAFNEAGCLACHFGANFAGPAPGPALKMGDGFYELFPTQRGSRYEQRYGLLDDLGRYEFSGDPGERYMWRVPPLRGIALSAPYFHNGSVATLDEAIRVMAKVQFGHTLSEQMVHDIQAFLLSLTGELKLE